MVVYDGLNFSGNTMTIADDIGDLSFFGFDKKIKSLKFFSMPTPSTVYYRSFNAASSFNSFSAAGDEYSCSGFFVSADGYLVTAAHCVLSDVFNATTKRYDPLVDFYVAVSGVNGNQSVNKVFPARLVGYDPYADVAVLKIDGLTTQQFLTWGSSRQTPIGSKVFVLGNPQGNDEDSFSSGIVRDNRYSGEYPIFYVESVLADTTIIPGNSGGPLLNTIGQVIGLSNYGIGSSNNFGGGVSQYIAQKIVDRIIAYDRAGRPVRSGFDASNASLTIPSAANHPFILNDGSHIHGFFNCVLIQVPKWFIVDYAINNDLYKGALVASVDPSSTLVGTIAEGDIILSIDGQDVGLFKSNVSPHSVFIDKSPGATVTITYMKNSEGYSTVRTATVPLSRAPNNSNYDSELMRQTVTDFTRSMKK